MSSSADTEDQVYKAGRGKQAAMSSSYLFLHLIHGNEWCSQLKRLFGGQMRCYPGTPAPAGTQAGSDYGVMLWGDVSSLYS